MTLDHCTIFFSLLSLLQKGLGCSRSLEQDMALIKRTGNPQRLTAGESRWVRFAESWTGPQEFYAYEGGGLTVISDSHALDCSFEIDNKCCWHNVGIEADELDWAVANRDMNTVRASGIFGTSFPPKAPFLITGSPRTYQWYQALLVSCPIFCQANAGRLTISHWLTRDVSIDVCRLAVGTSDFLGPCTTLKGSRTSTVAVPPHNQPFYIVLVASEFIGVDGEYGGGIASLDDIVYDGAQFC